MRTVLNWLFPPEPQPKDKDEFDRTRQRLVKLSKELTKEIDDSFGSLVHGMQKRKPPPRKRKCKR